VLKPNNAGVLSNLGNTQRDMFDLQSAITSLSEAVRNAPKSSEPAYNLGLALKDVPIMTRQLHVFEARLVCGRVNKTCHVDYGISLMLKGDLAKGFEEYDWRSKMTAAKKTEKQRWDGPDLKGKTILLLQEGGMGDVTQFLRYTPVVRRKAPMSL